MPSRRQFLKRMAVAASAGVSPILCAGRRAADAAALGGNRPNVLLIITDDQGYGDLSCHGNPHLKTPNIDRLYRESARFTHFHVSPVCAPTRSSLMTGRYNYRTGVVDTYQGRAMMYPDEITVAEVLAEAGYSTGIFGKWHLGDNYPMRPVDQGFQESLVHNGGGMAQPSDPPASRFFDPQDDPKATSPQYPFGRHYFDPILQHNGVEEKCAGYCTDIFAAAAIRFIEEHRTKPFFAYLATNAPHSPLEIDEKYVAPYRKMGLDETVAKTYGMLANVDENIGRVLQKLEELGLSENTLVVFMTDNGAAGLDRSARFNAGLRAGKGTCYDGGIRVPFFVRWPRAVKPSMDIDRIAAHIDVFPTILQACGVPVPGAVRLDGVSLMPLLTDRNDPWPDRTLYFQWHRGDVPERFRDCAARSQKWKLINGRELYDMDADPAEAKDVASDYPDVVGSMRAGYEKWFDDVGAARGYAPPRIHLGAPQENPVTLSRQDWRGSESWRDPDIGHWQVSVVREGRYDIRIEFPPRLAESTAHFSLNSHEREKRLKPGASSCEFEAVPLGVGDGSLETWIMDASGKIGARYVIVRRR